MKSLPWVLGGLVAGGILHILCVFGIPALAQRDAWTQLSAKLKTNTLAIADDKNPVRLPFTAPEVIYAYCVYDLSEHNLIVKSPLPEPSWSLAVYTRSGENFYLTTGTDVRKPELRLLIIRRDRLSEEASTEKTDEGDDQNIIVSPSQTGIIAIRAPIRGESFRSQTMNELKKARCEIEKSIEPAVASVVEPPAPQLGRSPYDAGGRYQRRRRRF